MLKEIFKNKKRFIWLFINYFWVGGIAAIVNFCALFVFSEIINIYYIYSNIISFILGLIVNYVLCKKYVFSEEVKINPALEFIIYGLIGVIGLGIDTSVLWLFTSQLKVYLMYSKIISTVVTFLWNFGARKCIYVYLEE